MSTSETATSSPTPLPAPGAATMPDAHGHFGSYGGMFVPETLMAALSELTEEYERAKADPAFQAELDHFGPGRGQVGSRRDQRVGVAQIEPLQPVAPIRGLEEEWVNRLLGAHTSAPEP